MERGTKFIDKNIIPVHTINCTSKICLKSQFITFLKEIFQNVDETFVYFIKIIGVTLYISNVIGQV